MSLHDLYEIDPFEIRINSKDNGKWDLFSVYNNLSESIGSLGGVGDLPGDFYYCDDIFKAHFLSGADAYDEYSRGPDDNEHMWSWEGGLNDYITSLRIAISEFYHIEDAVLNKQISPVLSRLVFEIQFAVGGNAKQLIGGMQETVLKFLVLNDIAGLDLKFAEDLKCCLKAGAIPCGMDVQGGQVRLLAFNIRADERYMDKVFREARSSNGMLSAFANRVELQSSLSLPVSKPVEIDGLLGFQEMLKEVKQSDLGELPEGWRECTVEKACYWLENRISTSLDVELYNLFLQDIDFAVHPNYSISNDDLDQELDAILYEVSKYAFSFAAKCRNGKLKNMALYGLVLVQDAILTNVRMPYVEDMKKVYLAGFIPAGFEYENNRFLFTACPIDAE